MKAAIYLRKSRAEELSDSVGETLKRHKDTLLDFAKNNDIAVIDIFEEVISGESLYARSEMLKLLDNVSNHKYEAVLCMDIDRLGRGVMSQQGIILETLKDADTKIITPRKIYDLNNEQDEEYTEFQAFFARRELKTITRRMKQGITKTIQDGGYIANAPYGYRKTKIGKLPSLEIVEDEAQFVRMIFDFYVNQNYGCQTIADTITSMGAKPRRGTAFNRKTIASMLRNAVYIGKIVWNKKTHIKKNTKGNDKHVIIYHPEEEWDVYEGLHEAIIDEDIFEKAQILLSKNYHPPVKEPNLLSNPLAGLVICANCGSKMQYRPYVKKGYPPHLLCTKTGCIKATPLHLVEKAILKSVADKLKEMHIEFENHTNSSNIDFEASITEIKKEISQTKAQQNSLCDFLEQGVYTIDVFKERNIILNDKLNKLSQSLDRLLDARDTYSDQAMIDKMNKIADVLEKYSESTINQKNLLLKSILEKVTYSKKKDWPTNKFIIIVDLK